MSTPFPDPIIKPFSNTGDNAAPPLGPIATAANQETGFPILEATPLDVGGIEVTREEFNGALNFYTKQILALVSGARFTFNQALSDEQNGYPIGAVLYCASDNSLQRSLKNNNTANFITTPSYINDEVNWSAVAIDNIFCENLVVNDGGVVSFLNPSSTHAATFQTTASLTSDCHYKWPFRLPPVVATPYDTPQVLASDYAGNMHWVFGIDTRVTYNLTVGSLITAPSYLKFNTLYDSQCLDIASPYDPTTGLFTAPIPATYKIEVNVSMSSTIVPNDIVIVKKVSGSPVFFSQLVSIKISDTTETGIAYCKLNNGEQIGLYLPTHDATPIVGSGITNQLSISWYSGIPS